MAALQEARAEVLVAGFLFSAPLAFLPKDESRSVEIRFIEIMDRIISADPSTKMNPQWQSIMRPIFIGDTELLENVQRNLEGRITFRLNGNKIVYDFQRAGGVEYRLARKGDWIHVQRRVGDLLAIRRSAEKGPQL